MSHETLNVLLAFALVVLYFYITQKNDDDGQNNTF